MFKKLFPKKREGMEFVALESEDEVQPVENAVVGDTGAQNMGKSRKKSKVWLFGGLGLVVVLLVVFVAWSMLFSKPKMDFYKVMGAVFDINGGSFHYEFDIKTGELGSLVRAMGDDLSVSITDMESLKGAGEDVKDSDGKSLVSWDKHNDKIDVDWSYPAYKIILDGEATPDPYGVRMDVYLVTELHNDKITEIVSVDGKTYLDVDALRGWLLGSRDKYLMGLGGELPDYSGKYIELSDKEVGLSGYAESGESMGISGTRVLSKWYNNWFRGFLGLFRGGDVHVEEGVVRVGYSGELFKSAMGRVLSFINTYGSAYRSVVSALEEEGLLSVSEKEQVLRELDNRLTAMQGLRNELERGLGEGYFGGVAREYDTDAAKVIEGVVAWGYSGLDGRDVMVKISGRRVAEQVMVTKPGGVLVEGGLEGVFETFYRVVDYLNITGVPRSKNLNIDMGSIVDNYVSDVKVFLGEDMPQHLFKENLVKAVASGDDIDARYKELGLLMKPYIEFGGTDKDVEVVDESKEPEDGLGFAEGDDVLVIVTRNAELSGSGLVVFDLEVLNRGDVVYDVDFGLVTLRSSDSVMVANNLALLRSRNAEFGETLESGLSVDGMSIGKGRLYFVEPEGAFELYVGDTLIGVVNKE